MTSIYLEHNAISSMSLLGLLFIGIIESFKAFYASHIIPPNPETSCCGSPQLTVLSVEYSAYL